MVADGLQVSVDQTMGGRRYQQDSAFAAVVGNAANAVEALRQSFAGINSQIVNKDAGTTATVAVVDARAITVANIGDSPALLVKITGDGGVFVADLLKSDSHNHYHKASNDGERAKAEARGGIFGGSRQNRLGGTLMVTRAFGDKWIPGISGEPDIVAFKTPELQAGERSFVIVGSDGLTDRLDLHVIGQAVKRWAADRAAGKGSLAKSLVNLAKRYNGNTGDNVTVAVIEFGADMPLTTPQVIGVCDGHGEDSENIATFAATEFQSALPALIARQDNKSAAILTPVPLRLQAAQDRDLHIYSAESMEIAAEITSLPDGQILLRRLSPVKLDGIRRLDISALGDVTLEVSAQFSRDFLVDAEIVGAKRNIKVGKVDGQRIFTISADDLSPVLRTAMAQAASDELRNVNLPPVVPIGVLPRPEMTAMAQGMISSITSDPGGQAVLSWLPFNKLGGVDEVTMAGDGFRLVVVDQQLKPADLVRHGLARAEAEVVVSPAVHGARRFDVSASGVPDDLRRDIAAARGGPLREALEARVPGVEPRP